MSYEKYILLRTEKKCRPHTHPPEPQAHRLPRRCERPFGGCSEKTGRSGADTQNRKQLSTGNPHQRVGNARGHEADRGRGAFRRVVRRQSEILRRHVRKGEHRGGSPAQGRGNSAHTRYTRPHRQGRAKAHEKGGTDEKRYRKKPTDTVRLCADDIMTRLKLKSLCRSDGEMRAAKGHRRF